MSTESEVRPNFFIVGAPKCGTTSVASWLDAHPEIFMCKPKEPYFFSRDIQSTRAANGFDGYLSLFKGGAPGHFAVGEASTTYLRSRIAIKRIEESFHNPKYIVCLRNPVDMARSVHGQLLKGGRENVASFSRAWALQESRMKGEGVPAGAGDPADLQYGEMCKLGVQVKKMLQYVDAQRVLFIFLEDLKNDPAAEYLRLLKFLDVADTGWRHFSVENARGIPKSLILVRALRFLSVLKNKLGMSAGSGIGAVIIKWITRDPDSKEAELDCETKRDLVNYFKSDIQLLSSLTNKNLDHWLVWR